MERLLDWCERHEGFGARLAQLRRIVPERDPDRTAAALGALEVPLRLHMAQEERVLFPAYAPLAADLPPNAALGVFQADHDRIRALLDALRQPAEGADGLLAQQRSLSLLAGVLEHHDLRERRWLKAVLDEALPAETRERWLSALLEEERSVGGAPGEALGCRPAPPPSLRSADPLRHLWLAVAQDAPLQQAWDRVPVPDHPKGSRLHARCAALVQAVGREPELARRRDRLAALSDQLRLLELITGSARPAAGAPPRRGPRGA